MPVTLRDIATTCGVDVSTVSRALRNDERVQDATRQRVVAAARRLGYRPNLLARQLVTGRTQTIWLLQGGIHGIQEFEPAQEASRCCQAKGYDMHVVLHHDDAAAHARALSRLRQGLADGAIVVASPRDNQAAALAALAADDFPLVFLDRHVPGLAVPYCTSDNAAAVVDLIAHCQRSGARAVCTLFGDGNSVERVRAEACRRACAASGLPLRGVTDLNSGDAPIALIASTQYRIQQQLNAIPELRRRTLIVACFDTWYGEREPAEAVFVARQDFPRMASRAVELLMARLDRSPAIGSEPELIPIRGIHTIE